MVRAVADFSFLTNHTHALVCIAREPGMRLRDIAREVGITERAAHRIIAELVQEGYLTRHRVGRRNYYEVHVERNLRHPMDQHHSIGELLRVLLDRPEPEAATEGASSGASS